MIKQSNGLNFPQRGEMEYEMLKATVKIMKMMSGDQFADVMLGVACLLKDNPKISIERAFSISLIDNKITHFRVKEWADKSGIIFPKDSNCVGCFHKPIQQLRKNWDLETNKMQWFADQEKKARWKKEMNYEQIKQVGLQKDFNFGTGRGCQGGFCTD